MLQFITEPHSKKSNPTRAKDYTGLSDRNLIRRVLRGETFLFKLLVKRHNNRLFRIQRSYISDEEAIKDTLQQTYMKAYEHLDSWRGNARFSTWITRIAINEALKYANNRNRYSELHNFKLNNGEENRLAGKTDRTPEDDVIQQDLKRVLQQAVKTLSTTYRKVYIKREMEQMSTVRTAENLGITPGNVKVRLHRARKKLRQTLEHYLAEPAILHDQSQ